MIIGAIFHCERYSLRKKTYLSVIIIEVLYQTYGIVNSSIDKKKIDDMNKKSDWIWPVVVFAAVLCLFNFKDTKLAKLIRPINVSSILTEKIDSIKHVNALNVEAFTVNHRISVNMTNHNKYYSSSDTLITVYDTSGSITIKPIRFEKMKIVDQKIIQEILQKK